MLIIFEGLDKSGKSMLAKIVQKSLHAVMIRKTYNTNLYPIDYSKASEYDWQAILDRVVLANPDIDFVADRSFFTQTAYQVCLGTGEHAITDAQSSMYNNYCKVVKSIPHLIVYCESAKYELDSMVTNVRTKNAIDAMYKKMLAKSELTTLILDVDDNTLYTSVRQILDTIVALNKEVYAVK